MRFGSSAIERLFARDPQAALQEVLAELIRGTGADSAALFLCCSGLELLGGVSVDQVCLDRTQAAWCECSAQLREGRPLSSNGWGLSPLQSARGPLLVYVAGAELDASGIHGVVESARELLELLANLDYSTATSPTAALPPPTIDSYLGATTLAEVQRRKLTILLQGTEWNITRAARSLGVTRATIYRRIRRLGVTRLRLRREGGRAPDSKQDAPDPPEGGEA